MKLVSPLMKKSINQSLLPHLEIHLRCAKNLPAMDISGKSDGFVIFSIGNESVRSTVVEANLNPVWSDRMLLGIPNCNIGDKLNTFDQLVLKVQVFDKDLLSKNDLISEFTVSFKEFKSEGLPLEKIVSLPGAECQKKNSTIDFSITCQNFNQISNSNKPMIANHYTVVMEKKIEAVQAKFEDSNIQFIGSREDIQQRIEAAKKEDAWFKCGNKVGIAPGLEIWRIEKFKVVPVLKETYGHFYDGDSYIILHTFKKENALYWNIHFWLGLNTSIDEMGVAAYKTVELDDLLGGGPVEFREVQGNESDEFLNLFPKGIRILSGGMETGFRHVKPEEYEPRLLQVKGKKNIKITEVPLLFSSLNQGDCFLLDAGLKLVLWEGSNCSNMERFKVNQLAQSIQAERGEKPVLIIAKDKASTNTAELSNLYSLLKGDEKDIKTALEGGDDEEQKTAKLSKPIVYKLSDSSGKMEFSKMQGNFALSNLNTNDAYIVDAGYKVFTWIGKNSSQNERKYANDFAVTYLRNNGKSLRTQISRVSEGNETATFLEVFDV